MIPYLSFVMALLLAVPTALFASTDCCGCSNNSIEFGMGWRRDNLNWKIEDLRGDSSASVPPLDITDSKMEFEDIETYMVNARAKFVDYAYYIRLEADYGWSDKGRAEEKVSISNSFDSFSASLSDPVKRRSELYDFSGAVGYPMLFCNRRWQVVPLVGFSFHRQYIRVENELHDDQILPEDLEELSDCASSPSFNSCGHVVFLSHHRLTWYGPFVGIDLGVALSCDWSLWLDFEYHYGRCNRKRESSFGVHPLDHYHFTDYAHGISGIAGTNIFFCDNWFGGLYVEFRTWKSAHSDDEIHWRSIAFNANLGLLF